MRHKLPALALAAALAASTFGAATAQAAPATSTTVKYLAVGDSYPAGDGLGPDPAHPALLGSVNYANVLANTQAASGDKTAQVAARLAENPGNKVVTVTVGANDVGWLEAIKQIQLGQPINLTDSLTALYSQGIPSVIFAANQANPGATILVTGYPHLFGSVNKGCTVPAEVAGQVANVEVTAAQAGQVNLAVDLLNSTIAASVAATRASAAGANINVAYVDVVQTFKNHGVCDSTPWLQNGSTTGPVLFHPDARGQKAYAQVIQQNGFQKAALNVSRG